MMINRQKVAGNNIRLKNVKRENSPNELIEFITENKTISINLNLESLNKILETERYLNVFELGYSLDEIKKRYNSGISPYFEKFINFVEMFDKNKRIKYGSLNVGDLGSNFPGFGNGNICLILNSSFIKKSIDRILSLKTFSLSYFNREQGSLKFDEEKFYRDISSWHFIEVLAFEKHINDYLVINRNSWPNMISNKRGWLEILIATNVELSDISEVRFKKEFYHYGVNLIERHDMKSYYEIILKEIWVNVLSKINLLNLKINTI